MNHDRNADWFIEEYDTFVSGTGIDGSELEKSRDAVAHRYADAVESGERDWYVTDLVSEGRHLFDQSVQRVRTKRKNDMRKSMDWMLDLLAHTMLGDADPILAQAYPLGVDDGRDKTLRHWTVDDWTNAWSNRFSKAAQAAAAADEFYQRAKGIVEAMQSAGVSQTGDLFRTP